MGQNNSKGDSKTSVPEYRPNFEVIRVIDDPNYGRVKLIREAKTHQQMILKEFIFDTKQAFEEELKFFKDRAAFDHPHIVQVIGYNATQNQNLCSSLFKVSIFIEILSKELQTAVRERKRSKVAYSEGDLLIIAENVIAALYHLQTKNMAHGDIRPVNIFVSGQTYKVTDPKLEIDKNANALVKAIISNQETLLSPQLLAKIPTKKFEITEDRYKADVFSLGATLLNVATLKNSEELYDYQNGKINQDLLRERLQEVKTQYSPFTYQLISDMLRIDEHERPDFVDLRDRLLPHHEAINTKQDLPFTHHNLDTFGGAPAAQARQGEKVKKAAVQLIDEDRHDSHHDHHEEERLPSFASETHHTANFGQPQRIEPAFHHPSVFATEHHVPAAVTHHEHHHEHHVEPPQFKSHLDTDDLEAKIRAALQRSQDTYKQVQESESHFGTHQPPAYTAHTTYQPHTTTFQATSVNQRPLVSFGASNDFAHTQFHHEDLHVPQPHVVERSYEVHSIGEHNVKAPRQPTWEVEYNRDITAGEHKVNAPRQPGWDVEINRDAGGEHKVNAPRQPGWDVEISRETGGERKVNAPRQPGWDEEQVKKSSVPQHHFDAPATRTSGFIHTDVPATRTSGFIHTDVPATRTSGFIHTDVPATRTSGFIYTPEAHTVPAKVEEHHYIPTTTPATYDINYTAYTYTPSGGYATQNLGLLENLKRTSEATLAHQQDLHRKSDTQSFGQPGSHHQDVVVKQSSPEHHAYESTHTYQPTTTYNIGGTTFGTTGLRASGEHHLRSSPGVVGTDDVRRVGEVGGNSALNTAAFTYTSFNLPKAAADDVMAFTPQTYTVEHAAPHTTTTEHTYNFTTGTLGQYGHHEPTTTYNFGTDQYKIGGTQDYHFTTPAAYTVHGGETEKIVKSYNVAGETPQSHGIAYSPTLPSVTPKHHVTNIQTTDFARGDTVTYGTHTPTHAYGNIPGADRPGGILGEVSSAVSKYTFTTVEESGQHQFGDSPARFV